MYDKVIDESESKQNKQLGCSRQNKYLTQKVNRIALLGLPTPHLF